MPVEGGSAHPGKEKPFFRGIRVDNLEKASGTMILSVGASGRTPMIGPREAWDRPYPAFRGTRRVKTEE
jgi:hypothetical protein